MNSEDGIYHRSLANIPRALLFMRYSTTEMLVAALRTETSASDEDSHEQLHPVPLRGGIGS